MGSEPHEAALTEAPQVAAKEMSDATDRLRDKAWMVAPLTAGVLDPAAAAGVRVDTR